MLPTAPKRALSDHYDMPSIDTSPLSSKDKKDARTDDAVFLDWASNVLLDPSPEYMVKPYEFAPPLSGTPIAVPMDNPIMRCIQYQNNVHNNLADPHTKQLKPFYGCRQSKIKCTAVAGLALCSQCEAKGTACTYSDPSGPEPKRAKLGHAHSGAHDTAPPNAAIAPSLAQGYPGTRSSLSRKPFSLQFPRTSFYIGPTAYLFDSNLLEVILGQKKPRDGAGSAYNKIEQVNLSEFVTLRQVGPHTHFVLKDDQCPEPMQTMCADVDLVEKYVVPHGQSLVDLYFRIIHPSYPVLHEKLFLEKYARSHREFSALLLAAMYVLAIQWWDYDPRLSRNPKPNVHKMLKIALANFSLEVLKRPKLSAVQAGLLLLQCKHIVQTDPEEPGFVSAAPASIFSSFSNESSFNSWVLCSQVVALAEELGLGLDCDGWKLPNWERGLRKRLAWAVYMEDKWLALENARPLHIHKNNFMVLKLTEDDFPENFGDGDFKKGSLDTKNGSLSFNKSVALSEILAEILDSLFSIKSMRDVTDIHEVLRIAKPIQSKLRLWFQSLQAELQMSTVQPRKLCSNGYLQLAYFATELTLHRKIITTIYQQRAKGLNISEDLVAVCRSAAKTCLLVLVDFIRDLKPEHAHLFWYGSLISNIILFGTFAALLFISSTSKEEADFYKDHMYNYRWVLKMSFGGFPQFKDALGKLDLVLHHIPGLLDVSVEQPIMVPPVPSDYVKHVHERLPHLLLQGMQHSQQGSQPLPLQTSAAGYGAPNQAMFPSGPHAGNGVFLNSQVPFVRPGSSVLQREKDAVPQVYQQGNGAGSAKSSQAGNSPRSTRALSPDKIRVQISAEEHGPEIAAPVQGTTRASVEHEQS